MWSVGSRWGLTGERLRTVNCGRFSPTALTTLPTILEYKGKLYGCEIRNLDRFFPSSKRCSKCEHIHENLTLDIREWICPECGTHPDRDVNAAVNILVFCDPQILLERQESTPKEPVARQGINSSRS
jgi:putative transposase